MHKFLKASFVVLSIAAAANSFAGADLMDGTTKKMLYVGGMESVLGMMRCSAALTVQMTSNEAQADKTIHGAISLNREVFVGTVKQLTTDPKLIAQATAQMFDAYRDRMNTPAGMEFFQNDLKSCYVYLSELRK